MTKLTVSADVVAFHQLAQRGKSECGVDLIHDARRYRIKPEYIGLRQEIDKLFCKQSIFVGTVRYGP